MNFFKKTDIILNHSDIFEYLREKYCKNKRDNIISDREQNLEIILLEKQNINKYLKFLEELYERLEAERLEAERLEAEMFEAEMLEYERLDAEMLEYERLEAEMLEAEKLEAEILEAEMLEAERLEAASIEPCNMVLQLEENDIIYKNNFNDKEYLSELNSFCNIMNVTEHDVLSNPKQEFRYFCYKYMNIIKSFDLPIITKNSYYEAVLIEFRCLPHLEFLIRNSIYKLGENWSQTIICGNLNYDFIFEIVKNIDRDIKIIKLNYNNLTQGEYSALMMSNFFWNLPFGEKVLIYQEDSCALKSNIDDFLEWDYIGAPWPEAQNDNIIGVGNGGFSLRTKSIMLEIIDKISPFSTIYSESTIEYMKNVQLIIPPEDVYFTLNMLNLNIGKLATRDIAGLFSSETIFNKTSFGFHNLWLCNKKWKDSLKYHLLSYNLVDRTNYNILGITTLYGLKIGGGEQYLLQLAKYFINYKNCVIYLFIDEDSNTIKNTIKVIIGENYIKYFKLFSLENSSYFYKKIDYHFVMGNSSLPYTYGLAKNTINNIYHCQFPFDTYNAEEKYKIDNFKMYSKIIVNSEYTKYFYELFTKNYLNNEQIIRVLYPNCLTSTNIENINFQSKELNSFVLLGRIFDYNPDANNKNFDIALKYFEELSYLGYNNFTIYIVGQVYSETMLEKLKNYKIKNLFIFENASEEVKYNILKKTQYILNLVGLNRDKNTECYAYEHFGISIVEGINNGCIPITVDGGYPSYYVEHLINGFKFNNESEFYNILKSIICENNYINYNFDNNFLNKFSLLNYNKTLTNVFCE